MRPTFPLTFWLPYPPSVNTYWRQFQGRAILSARGRQYRKDAAAAIVEQRVPRLSVTERLAIDVEFTPPKRGGRITDIDNLTKGLLDALHHSGVIEDDGQVDKLTLHRPPKRDGNGIAWVRIQEYDAQ